MKNVRDIREVLNVPQRRVKASIVVFLFARDAEGVKLYSKWSRGKRVRRFCLTAIYTSFNRKTAIIKAKGRHSFLRGNQRIFLFEIYRKLSAKNCLRPLPTYKKN